MRDCATKIDSESEHECQWPSHIGMPFGRSVYEVFLWRLVAHDTLCVHRSHVSLFFRPSLQVLPWLYLPISKHQGDSLLEEEYMYAAKLLGTIFSRASNYEVSQPSWFVGAEPATPVVE